MDSRKEMYVVVLAAIFVGQFAVASANGDTQDDPEYLPVKIVPWANVTNRLDSSDVVILCLVGSYDPSKPSEYGPHDKTPAQMLEGYLKGVRRLGRKSSPDDASDVYDSKKVSILIVEGGEENRHASTREKARQLHAELGIPNYDKSIPVIYVFQKGKLVTTYTYRQSPGMSGHRLRDLIVDLLSSTTKKAANNTIE